MDTVSKLLIVPAMLVMAAWVQSKPEPQLTSDMARPEFQLVEENEYYVVQRVVLENDSQVTLPQHGKDVIVVALGDGLNMNSVDGAVPEKPSEGDVRFLDKGTRATLQHSGAAVAQVLFIGLKHHWDAEIRPCATPKTCSRPIRAGGREIGQSESLFTNGFVTAYRHRMDRGGTLDTSYYSKNGTHHLMLVALDDLRANFEGTEQELRRGQVLVLTRAMSR